MPGGPAVARGHGEGIFQGAGGLKLYYQRWLPETWPPRAILAIVQGPGIYGALYTGAVSHLGPHGYAVYGFQHREHVRSPGQRGYVIEWGQSRGDVRSFLRMITEQEQVPEGDRDEPVGEQDSEEQIGPEPDIPLFLLGSGLGGSIVMTYALHHPEDLTGVVALNPVSGPREGQSLLARLSRALLHMWPRFPIASPIDYSTVPAEQRRGQATTAANYSESETAGFSAESHSADGQIEVQTGDLSVPHLILRGGPNDPLLAELERWLEEHL